VESTEYGAAVVTEMVVHVTVRVGDDERTDEAARLLLADLGELPEVRRAVPAAGAPPPDGARSGEAVALGGIVVTAFSQPETIGAVVRFVCDRIGRRAGSVEVQIGDNVLKVQNATAEQIDVLVDAFVRKAFDQDS